MSLQKRALSMLLTVVMVLGMLPLSAMATGNNLPFIDVSVADWFYDGVKYAYDNGLVVGTTDTTFEPSTTTTRAMVVTILYRLEGSPAVATSRPFTDVSAGSWYTDAIEWASANDIVDGYGGGLFGPNDTINREQMATIFYRYSKYKGYDLSNQNSLSAFSDFSSVSDWAKTALAWANAEGLITGTSSTTLSPKGAATRAEIAVILQRFCTGNTGDNGNGSSKTCSVTFYMNDGTDEVHSTSFVTKGGKVSEPETPIRNGYTFIGWYTDVATTEAYRFGDVVAGSLDLYAKWNVMSATDYYTNNADLLEIIKADESDAVLNEVEAKTFFDGRGFGTYAITYEYFIDGSQTEETEITENPVTKHPMYQSIYVSKNNEAWIIYVINGSIFAYPFSFGLESDLGVDLIFSESNTLTSFDDTTNQFYVTIPHTSEMIVETVETINARTLDSLTIEKICNLSGATVPLSADKSSYNSASVAMSSIDDIYDATLPVSSRSGDTDPFIVVSLGDSFSSGEGIENFYGQYSSLEDKVQNDDWLAHRSTKSWPGQICVPSVDGEFIGPMSNYKVSVGTTSSENIQWYFVASSGATTWNFEHKQSKSYKKSTLEGNKDLPPQLDVFDYINGDVDYVTLTIGGNDVDFVGIIMCCIEPTYLELGNNRILENKLDDIWANIDSTMADIKHVYEKIHAKAPNAAIIVAGYPKLLEKSGKGMIFSKHEAMIVNEKVSAFNLKIKELVESSESTLNTYFVDVEKEFDGGRSGGHQAYSSNEWINPIIFPKKSEDIDERGLPISNYSIHPNEQGAQAYARCVNAIIEKIEDSGTVSVLEGTVVDATDHTIAIEGASIEVRKDNVVIASAESDGSGKFSVTVSSGDLKVDITKDGYLAFTSTEAVCDSENHSMGLIELTPDPGEDPIELNGHNYQRFEYEMNWYDAKAYCEQLGGHLVTITSAEEQLYITNLVDEATKRSYWIGLSDEAESGNWTWVTGEAYSYSNWAKNEPNHGYGGSEHYVAVVSYDTRYDYEIFQGEWNDHALSRDLENFGFICEWDDAEAYESYQSRKDIWLEELPVASSDRYTGNMGDSFIDRIGTRNGKTDIVGNTYSHGLEAWVARWNFTDEVSWVWNTYKLDGKYSSLTGTVSVIADSYNTSNFDTTLEISGDGHILYSTVITPQTTQSLITVNVAGVNELKIYLYDNSSASGGTSFALGNFKLS